MGCISIPRPEEGNEKKFRKMFKLILQDTKICIRIYCPNKENESEQKKRQRKKNLTQKEALIVNQQGKSYLDILNEVKSAVESTTHENNIKGVRKTQNRNFLITFSKLCKPFLLVNFVHYIQSLSYSNEYSVHFCKETDINCK